MSVFIHDFIQQMTMREKAYFKRFAQMQSGKDNKNYLQLYGALEKMQVFNIEKLEGQFNGQTIGKYINSELNYLLGQLFKSTLNFYLDSNAKRKLQKSLLYVDFLIEKGYKKQALKILDKTKKLATKQEDFNTILKIIHLKEELLFKQGILHYTKNLEALGLERQKVNTQISNINHLRLLREQFREYNMNPVFILHEGNRPSFFSDPILQSEKNALTVRAKEHWFYVIGCKNLILNEHKKSIFYLEKAVSLVEKNPLVLKKSKALPLMSNYLYSCALQKNKSSFLIMLAKLESFEKEAALDKAYISFIKYIRTFELYYQTNDTEASRNLEQEAKQFIYDESSKIEFSLTNYVYFCLVRSCIISERYEKAADWLNDWKQFGAMDFWIIHIKLFSLITHFELGMIDLIQTEIETIYKSLKRKKKYDDLPKAFLQFFRSYLRNTKKKKLHLEMLNSKLSHITQDPLKNFVFLYFDYSKWVAKEIERL